MDLQMFSHYKLGIEEIDNQHIQLFIKTGELIKHIADKDIVRKLLADLITDTKIHFASEELYMRVVGYPYIMSHMQAHTGLLARLDKLNNNIDTLGRFFIDKHYVQELNKILLMHIDHYDMQIADYVKKKNS